MLKKKYKLKPLFKHQLLITAITVFIVVISFFGGSYAIFMRTKTATEYNEIKVGDILLSYVDLSEEGNALELNNDYPVSDEVGENGGSYRFSVENNGSHSLVYRVVITDDEAVIETDGCSDNLVDKSNIKYKLDNGEIGILSDLYDSELEGYLIYTGTLEAGESNIHEIRLWLKEDSDNSVLGAHFHGKVMAVLEQDTSYADNSGANSPLLINPLVAVKISPTGTVTKADTSENWYDYDNNQWANAVILKDEKIKYAINEEIPEENIESYFVWIPKFDYQIFDMGEYTTLGTKTNSARMINIRFSNDNTVDNDTECAYPLANNQAVSGSGFDNCSIGKWMTHPAFTTLGTTGFWIGKFETGYDSPNLSDYNEVNPSKIIIKPNVYSWRGLTVANAFKNSYDYKRNLDSHMMKNTEWGAVAYLSSSKYGYKDEISIDAIKTKPVINNNGYIVTGCVSVSEPTVGFKGESIEENRYEYVGINNDGTYTKGYLNNISQLSSTTGNYSGIFDMVGGGWEYVMGYTTKASKLGGDSKLNDLYPDFFDDVNYNRYWDKYTSGAESNFNNRILGDATGEMGPFQLSMDPDNNLRQKSSWNDNYAYFALTVNPWYLRGGTFTDGTLSGLFAFYNYTGSENGLATYRIVLSPTN